MEQGSQTQRAACAGNGSATERAGRYVYCVASADKEISLGRVGIAGSQVYTVVRSDLCAVVHDCPAQPYHSDEAQVVAAWVLAHHQVVESAWKRWGTVIPLTFNTIIRAEQGSAEDNLKAWLGREHARLKEKLEALAGKAEYGVQVFWDPQVVARRVAGNNPEVRKLEETIRSKPRGTGYMYRQKLESLLKREVEARAAVEFKDLYGRLSGSAGAIRVERTKKGTPERQMLMNLSCLLSSERYSDIEAELDRVSNTEGFSVHLAGPLPPYSFC